MRIVFDGYLLQCGLGLLVTFYCEDIAILLSSQAMLELHIRAVQLSAGKQYLINIWTDYNTLEINFRSFFKYILALVQKTISEF